MSEGEVMVLLLSFGLALLAVGITVTSGLHPLYFRGNPAPGIVRLGVLAAMGWIAYVLTHHADPSVTGIYVFFYLVVGYAAVKLFGQVAAEAMGLRTRVDAGERGNVSVALVIAAFTLATGMIFGGSLWGEADPVADDEGGWWIPVTFFLLGWVTLVAAFALFRRREGRLVVRLRRDRSVADGRAAAAFLLSSGLVLTDAVAGDFWGWAHGLLSFGILALLLLVHEAFAAWTREEDGALRRARPLDARRALESLAYLLLGAVAWGAGRYVDLLAGAPL